MFNQTNLKFREMKKSIFMFALATLMSASVFAQDNDAKRLPGYKTTFEGNGFWNKCRHESDCVSEFSVF